MTYLPKPISSPVAAALSGADGVNVLQNGLARLTTLAALKAFVTGGTAPSVVAATSASAIVGAPSSGMVGATISGMTVTLTPAGSTAYAVISNGKTDIGTRIAFS